MNWLYIHLYVEFLNDITIHGMSLKHTLECVIQQHNCGEYHQFTIRTKKREYKD